MLHVKSHITVQDGMALKGAKIGEGKNGITRVIRSKMPKGRSVDLI